MKDFKLILNGREIDFTPVSYTSPFDGLWIFQGVSSTEEGFFCEFQSKSHPLMFRSFSITALVAEKMKHIPIGSETTMEFGPT